MSARTLLRALPVLVAVAIVTAALLAVWLYPTRAWENDTESYVAVAQSMLSGDGVSTNGRPEFFRTPGYPVLLAVGALTGSFWTVSLLQYLLMALSLVLCFFATAVLYLLLHAEFNALAQTMVYVGGILVFMVFAILMTSSLGERDLESGAGRRAVALLLSGAVLCAVVRALSGAEELLSLRKAANEGFASFGDVGRLLLSPAEGGQLVAFELATALLLDALVGVVAVARRPAPKSAPEEEERR